MRTMFSDDLFVQISSVKSSSDQMYPQLKVFQPRKRNTLNEFVKDFEQSRAQNCNGFITASQLGKSLL